MALQKITGSGGTTPVQDGSARGIIAAAVSSAATGVCVRLLDVPEGDYLNYIQPVVVFAAFAGAGFWDRYVSPRLATPGG